MTHPVRGVTGPSTDIEPLFIRPGVPRFRFAATLIAEFTAHLFHAHGELLRGPSTELRPRDGSQEGLYHHAGSEEGKQLEFLPWLRIWDRAG